MNNTDHTETVDAAPNSFPDLNALIASLRTGGAHRFDPVRMHYIEVLAKRAESYQGSVRRMLDAKLARALAEFKESFDAAYSEAREIVACNARQHTHAGNELQRLFAAGDFKEVRRLSANLPTGEQRASLGELVRQLEQHALKEATPGFPATSKARPEPKSIQTFKHALSKLNVSRQVSQALEQAPKNAGPINSHMLVLRSLALMRDISPDYLNRFMSYAETLLCLDQGEKEKPATSRKSPAARAGKK